MAISDKLQELLDIKQDIKTAIETKGIPMTGVPFTEYANKIADISGGGGGGGDFPTISYDEIEYFGWSYYMFSRSNVIEQVPQAWQDMKEVNGAEIERSSTFSVQYGTLQYPKGEDNGVIIPDGVTSIGNNAFRNWRANNQPLVIPDSVTSIGASSFQDWRANNHPLIIPDSVTSIGNNAFHSWHSNNQPLVIPNSITNTGGSVFVDWNSNNQPLVIPDSITSIGVFAFYGWSSNNHPLVIPDSVTSISSSAFNGWSLVPYVEIKAITPPTLAHANAFANQNNAPIYVPDESVDDYKTATNWVDLADRIFSINDK